ncbi:MAG: hypothetical protein LC687_03945 [Actinobacteria bacterium]|nr:hypothetical protein [Actinomycetota bacterium]
MRENTVGTHKGDRTLTAYDPIKNKPGSELYNSVSGPQNTVQGAAKPIAEGSYGQAPAQVGNVFANVRQPSVPRRQYIPTVTL